MKKQLVAIVGLCLLAGLAKANGMNTSIYGYVDAYYENVDDSPEVNTTTKAKNAGEFDVPNINVIVQSTSEKSKVYLNLSGGSADTVSVSNAWVDHKLAGEFAMVRFGKLYRPFGLYNEILDAVPTYIGIEPPELFDGDHLLLSRTTNFMLHGKVPTGNSLINWSLTTGNDDKTGGFNNPVGVDLRWEQGSRWKVGTSFYSTGGYITSPDGTGGTFSKWTREKYSVMGLYSQFRGENWTVQAAYYKSPHEGDRDATAYCALSSIDDFRRERAGCNSTPITATEHDIITYYVRAGYDFYLGDATVTPYMQYDYYKNPEIPFSKSEGGDKEAGLSNDGSFVKLTAGVVYRPDYNMSLKFDYSQHRQKVDTVQNSIVDGSASNYGEYRVSLSYFWKL